MKVCVLCMECGVGVCAGVDVGRTNKQTEVNEKDYRITGERKETQIWIYANKCITRG